MYIEREIESHVRKLAGFYPIVTVTGPRQSGKTTLIRHLFPQHAYYNLETGDVRDLALADPKAFVSAERGPMILDEVQKLPQLLEYVQASADQNPGKGRFILTGSHQPELAQAVSETLAGRTGVVELLPLSFAELKRAGVDVTRRDRMLLDGFMPRRLVDAIDAPQFYADYFRTYVERDARRLLNVSDLDRFKLFVKLLAGHVGRQLNKQSLANDVGVSDRTIANWLSVLRASYIIFPVKPYHNNFGKRQTKAPKICFAETGLATYLLGIRTVEQLATHPLMGHLFENMVTAEALKYRLNRGLSSDLYFYRNASGSVEVDLLLEDGPRLLPREVKSSSTYVASMSANLKAFCALAPQTTNPLVVYSGASSLNVVAHYADTEAWAGGSGGAFDALAQASGVGGRHG